MNIKLTNDLPCGYVFSMFMQMFPNIQRIGGNIENIYFNSIDKRFSENPFNWVFDQDENIKYIELFCFDHGLYTDYRDYSNCPDLVEYSRGPIEESVILDKLKKTAKSIKIKKQIIDFVDLFSQRHITNKTLGVHVRVGDMNTVHTDFGIFHTEDYISKIREIINNEDIDTIFVASDNVESIKKIKKVFNNVVYYECDLREPYDADREIVIIPEHFRTPKMWGESFTDMLLLSRCSKLLCRVSNLANASVVFSNTINKIYRL